VHVLGARALRHEFGGLLTVVLPRLAEKGTFKHLLVVLEGKTLVVLLYLNCRERQARP
jgi:hypothetical protein